MASDVLVLPWLATFYTDFAITPEPDAGGYVSISVRLPRASVAWKQSVRGPFSTSSQARVLRVFNDSWAALAAGDNVQGSLQLLPYPQDRAALHGRACYKWHGTEKAIERDIPPHLLLWLSLWRSKVIAVERNTVGGVVATVGPLRPMSTLAFATRAGVLRHWPESDRREFWRAMMNQILLVPKELTPTDKVRLLFEGYSRHGKHLLYAEGREWFDRLESECAKVCLQPRSIESSISRYYRLI